jgi:succinate-semialdehyde dehydrogenase/glutarate-semialdehyde dehydrogenase
VATTTLTASPETLVPINPATLEPVGSVRTTPPEELGDVLSEARAAQAAWAARPLPERGSLLRRVAHELLDAADEIALTIVAETGKPVVEAYTSELFVCLDHAAWLARHARRVLRPERIPFRQPHLLHKRGWLAYEPLGVAAIVSPWNFPLGVPFTQVATAVAAGNAAVVKPSELTPLTGAWLEELFRRAGAPHGLVQVVQGSGPALGDALVGHPDIHAVVFTGSTETGRRVAARAAERLVPAVLELGGKDPMIVLADADLERAVDGALWGAFTNCGQVCSGIERVYVEGALFAPFLDRLAARAASLRIGAGSEPATDLGPLVTEHQRARVESVVADALEHGARLVTGGGRPDIGLPGWFHEPTVLAGEPPASRIGREEVFGPVVTVVRIENEADGVRQANRSSFALGASVWTRDLGRGRRVAAALEAGSVWLNDHAYSYGVCQAPWGGRKDSGHGRTHSKHGLYAMTHVKFTDVDGGRFRPPWWYPYSGAVLDGFRGALGGLYGDGPATRARALLEHRGGLVELARKVRGR